MGAMKNDVTDGKITRRYVHPRTKEEIELAHMAGSIKYSDFNFLKGHTVLQLLDAMERHIDKYRWGEDVDKDCTERLGRTVTHLGCIGACLNMLCAQLEIGTITDDRVNTKEILNERNKNQKHTDATKSSTTPVNITTSPSGWGATVLYP